MSYSNFKYCPFCGSHITDNNLVKYCSFCGGNLLLNDDKALVPHHDENILTQDNLALEQVAADFDLYAGINFDTYNKAKVAGNH